MKNNYNILPPFMRRVFTEAEELKEKITLLEQFIDIYNDQKNETFSKLDTTEKFHLQEQLSHMKNYHSVLCARINYYQGKL